MRILSDSRGIEWTVFEVKRGLGAGQRMTYLPAQFGDGWLCFESSIGKRRLTPIPARWREFGDDELLRMLNQATPVNRPRDTGEIPRVSSEDEPRVQG